MHRKIVPALSALVAVVVLAWVPIARGGIFEGAPDVILCTVAIPALDLQKGQLAFYPSARVADGSITQYLTLGVPPLVLTIDASGVVDAGNLPDCNGKTIEALRADNRAYDLR